KPTGHSRCHLEWWSQSAPTPWSACSCREGTSSLSSTASRWSACASTRTVSTILLSFAMLLYRKINPRPGNPGVLSDRTSTQIRPTSAHLWVHHLHDTQTSVVGHHLPYRPPLEGGSLQRYIRPPHPQRVLHVRKHGVGRGDAQGVGVVGAEQPFDRLDLERL